MTERFIAILDPSRLGDLPDLAASRGWLPTGPWPWRFLDGWTRGWTTPGGATVHVVERTVFETCLLSVCDDREGLAAELVRLLRAEGLEALGRRWEAARTDEEKVRALLDLGGAQSMGDGKVLPQFEAAVRAALGDAHPVVRLAAIRALGMAPAHLGLELLRGREDPDNPGLAGWRDLFAEHAAAPGS